MTSDQKEFLDNVCEAYKDDRDHASSWEQGFMDDMVVRVEKYEADTYISAKQWGIITRVAEKYGIE